MTALSRLGMRSQVHTLCTLSRSHLHARKARIVLPVTSPGTPDTPHAESGVRYQSRPHRPDFGWGLVWPVIIVGIGVLVLVSSMRRGEG